jgi:energy-coupling factor transporter ATP-binding protein EcfA2
VSEALKRWSRFVHVHAALVATPNRSALLVGRSGSGKSTTSVALALAGLEVYTDDLALLDRATLRPLSLPRPVKLDHRARRLLQKRGLVLPCRASIGESIDRTALPGLPPMNVPGPPLAAAIFFVGNRRDRAEVRPLTGAEAVMRLVRNSASERIDSAGPSEGAVALVNAVRCYELIPGDLDSTVNAVLDLLQAVDDSAAESGRLAKAFVA